MINENLISFTNHVQLSRYTKLVKLQKLVENLRNICTSINNETKIVYVEIFRKRSKNLFRLDIHAA